MQGGGGGTGTVRGLRNYNNGARYSSGVVNHDNFQGLINNASSESQVVGENTHQTMSLAKGPSSINEKGGFGSLNGGNTTQADSNSQMMESVKTL